MKDPKFKVKLAALVLLLTENEEVSRTSLNKLLFFTDVAYFIRTGKPFSESRYIKMQYGPVPENISHIREILIATGWIQEEEQNDQVLYSYYYKNIADTSTMDKIKNKIRENDPELLEIIQKVNLKLRPKTAGELSRISHMYEPWKSALWNDELDFERIKLDDSFKKWLEDELDVVLN